MERKKKIGGNNKPLGDETLDVRTAIRLGPDFVERAERFRARVHPTPTRGSFYRALVEIGLAQVEKSPASFVSVAPEPLPEAAEPARESA